MPRFFVAPEKIKGSHVYITGPVVNHIARVLRLGPGDRLTLLDGLGWAYEAVIEKTGREEVICAVREKLPAGGAPLLKITLVQGIPKGDKMDLIVQKGTELGVSRVVPLVCRRAVVKLAGDKPARRQERWQRIALEAARQCRRPDVPEVCGPADWDRVLADLPPQALAIIPWEAESIVYLKDLLRKNDPGEEIFVFIGPEGGFTPEEVERAREAGVQPVSLGPRILRTETAGLAVLAMILYQWGDLGGCPDE
ncbi:MAG: 16S rRNA (uracil(1498)-N(3))-methyltransferase [Peptococcaceae bacterium]|nr:16S rRNA (uracil(1498)-N(3))-methyltransferase [Peptococcaceae bacterium]